MKWALALLLAFPLHANAVRLGGQTAERAVTLPSGPPLAITSQPFTRTVTCTGAKTLTGTATGAGAVTWSASPDGASGACTGTTSWSCPVAVSPNAAGEGVETITVSQSGGGSATVTLGFYVAGAHSCFLAQSYDGAYNAGKLNLDAVGTWVNLGSSALNVTQSTGSAQPSYRTTLYGQQPGISCDGGDRIIGATAADWTFLHTGVDYTTDTISRYTAFTSTGIVLSTMTGSGNTILGARDAYVATSGGRFFYNVGNGAASNFLPIGAASTGDAFRMHLNQTTLQDDAGAGIDASIFTDGAANGTAARANAYGATDANAIALCGNPVTGTGANFLTGDIWRVTIYSSKLSTTQLGINEAVDEWALGGTFPINAANLPQVSGSVIDEWAFSGDSLTSGTGGVTSWPTKLVAAKLPVGFTSDNWAVTTKTTAAMVYQWDENTPNYPKIVFILGGVNDMDQSLTAAVAFANLENIYTLAKASGSIVVALTTTPWGGYVSWSAGKQTQTEALNALVMASTIPDYKIDLYALMGDADPKLLNPTYDFGDGLHYTEAGTAFIAATVATALGL